MYIFVSVKQDEKKKGRKRRIEDRWRAVTVLEFARNEHRLLLESY